MPAWWSRGRVVVTLIAFVFPTCVFSFEGWEHQAIGDAAFAVSLQQSYAFTFEDDRLKTYFEEVTQTFKQGLNGLDAEKPLTYGRINMLVDYMRDPYQMSRGMMKTSGWPKTFRDVNIRHLEQIGGDIAGFFSATHSNHDHFLGRAPFTHWLWHKEAVAAAAEGNLIAGLLLNAYADHFLQDFFAPGHIIAMRDENSHNAVALMFHDHFNERGLIYELGAPNELLSSLNALKEVALQAAPLVPARAKRPVQNVSFLQTALALEKEFPKCPTQLELKGDGDLFDNDYQAALLVVYCARSIIDVLESYATGRPVNHFQDYTFHFTQGSVQNVEARLAFGKLVCRSSPSRTIIEKYLKPKENPDFGISENILATANPLFGVTLGMQVLAEPELAKVRALMEVETPIFGWRGDNLDRSLKIPSFLRSQGALTIGYSGVYNENEAGHGFISRLIIPAPKINAQISVFGGMRYYSNGGVDEWADFQGARLEWGMHISSLFFGIGRDHFTDRSRLRPELFLEAGVTFAFPFSRFTHYTGIQKLQPKP